MSRSQLLASGITRHQIATRLMAGRLHELHRGVYLVGHMIPPRYAPEMAALLACAPNAILSHRTAAALWALLPYPAPPPVCVTIPPRRTLKRPAIEIHRTRVDRRDIRHRHGLTLASPPRTILDLAPVLALDDREALVAEAHYRHLATEPELHDQLARNPGKRGNMRLRTILDLPNGPQRTRSPAERDLLAVLRRHRITGFETNARIHGYEVDFLFGPQGLVVEVDGYDAHSGRAAFERDRLKLATLTAAGLRVMQVTGRQVRRDERGVLDRLLRALG